MTLSRIGWLAVAHLTLLLAPSHGEEPDVDSLLERLKSGDSGVRIEALRALQTSLDPRIPNAVKPLLRDDGTSIRRLAARAIGSRYWQVPADDHRTLLDLLKVNATRKAFGEKNMALRAIGLLQRKYTGPMFARSRSRRWVVYERRMLPCLIDTKSKTEELLGWKAEGTGALASSWGNSPLNDSVLWHPRDEMVAFSILESRKVSTIWIWSHGKGLKVISVAEFAKALGVAEDRLFFAGGFSTEIKRWKRDQLIIQIYYAATDVDPEAEPKEFSAELSWTASTGELKLIKIEPQ